MKADLTCDVVINDRPFTVPSGTTVAAAVARAGVHHFRSARTGSPRAPLCGMGVCFECRLTVNSVPHVRSCQTICTPGMEIRTDG